MKFIKELTEAMTRNDQLKAAFTAALEDTIKKYPEQFAGDKAKKARTALLAKFDSNVSKSQISSILSGLGIGESGTMMSNQIAQFLLNQTNKLDKP